MRAQALAALEAGYVPLPVVPGAKSPALPWREYQATRPTRDQVESWFGGPSNSQNLGFVTGTISDLVVVDVDPRHGGDHSPFVGTTPLVVRSPSGGWHFYYRSDGQAVRTRAGVLPGVDIRGEGGFVVAPPSRRSDGTYRWEGHGLVSPVSLPPFSTVAARLQPAKPTRESSLQPEAWITEALKGVGEGERNATCARLAGYFLKHHPKDVARQMVREWAHRCRPPMNDLEATQTFDSILARDQRRTEAPTVQAVSCDDYLAANFSAAPRPWIVPGLVPGAALVVVAGAPRSFKSLLVTDLAAAVAVGRPFLGFPVKQGPVILMQLEDPPFELAQRLAAALAIVPDCSDGDFSRTPTPSGAPLYVDKQALFRLSDEGAVKRLREQVAQIRPTLLIVDPLYMAVGERAMASDDYFAGTSHAIKFFASLRDEFGVATVIVHHTRKRGKQDKDEPLTAADMYGSTFINAACEGSIMLQRPEGSNQVKLLASLKAGSGVDGSRTFEISYDGTKPLAYGDPEATQDKAKPKVKEALLAHLLGFFVKPRTAGELKKLTRASQWELKAALEVLEARGAIKKEGRRYVAV